MHVLHDSANVSTEQDNPLENQAYNRASRSLLEELTARLPYTGAIFRNDNATVYIMIEKLAHGTSVVSMIKSFVCCKDGRSVFQALIANYASDAKYRAIIKKKMNLLQNAKWNRHSYLLKSHISNHHTAVDVLNECSAHITVAVRS